LDNLGFEEAAGAPRFVAKLATENKWTWERAGSVVFEYRRFLVLAITMPDGVSPPPDIDEAWHLHILHTRAYQRFCEQVAGRFLHHTPSRGDLDAPRLRAQYEATRAGYFQLFATWPPPAIWPSLPAD
jgi:hypothetical protein